MAVILIVENFVEPCKFRTLIGLDYSLIWASIAIWCIVRGCGTKRPYPIRHLRAFQIAPVHSDIALSWLCWVFRTVKGQLSLNLPPLQPIRHVPEAVF